MDIPLKDINDLGEIARAIAGDVEQSKPASADAFGIWKNRQEDGLDYQQSMRSECSKSFSTASA